MASEGYPLYLEEEYLPAEDVPRWSDRRAELMLGSLVVAVVALLVAMIVFVFIRAWPSFAHNGLSWFLPGGDANLQLQDIFNSPANPKFYVYKLHAWPLVYSTALTTFAAVLIGITFAVLSAVFIVEFAPERLLGVPARQGQEHARYEQDRGEGVERLAERFDG